MKLIKTTLYSASITIIRIASNFISGKIIALLTGPFGIAMVGQFTNFVSIVSAFSNGAINNGVVKYTSEYEKDDNQLIALFSTAFKITLYCSLCVGSVLFIFGVPLSNKIFSANSYANILRIFGLTIMFYSLNTLFISILNGKKQIRIYTIANACSSIIGLLLTIVLVFFLKTEGALYSIILTQSISFFVTLLIIKKVTWFKKSYFNQVFNKKIAIKLSHYSYMAIITALTAPITQIFLRNIIIDKLGINVAGYWQGMMRISDGYLQLIIISLSTYYLPKLSSLHIKEELRNEIFQAYKIVLPVVVFSSLLIYLSRYFIIHLLYSSDFNRMDILFPYQLIGDFFKIAVWLLGYLMIAKAMIKEFIIIEIFFSASYVGLGYIFINSYGIVGATMAFALNYFISLIVMIIIFRRLLFKLDIKQ